MSVAAWLDIKQDHLLLLLDGSVSWLDTTVVMGDTPNRARGIGYLVQGANSALKSENARHHSDHPDAAYTPGRGRSHHF